MTHGHRTLHAPGKPGCADAIFERSRSICTSILLCLCVLPFKEWIFQGNERARPGEHLASCEQRWCVDGWLPAARYVIVQMPVLHWCGAQACSVRCVRITSGCPHWRSLIGRALTVELLQKRFRDPLFQVCRALGAVRPLVLMPISQKTLVGGAGECLSCKSRFTLENMWACLEVRPCINRPTTVRHSLTCSSSLQCEGVDAVRCGRNANKHSGAHYQSTKVRFDCRLCARRHTSEFAHSW